MTSPAFGMSGYILPRTRGPALPCPMRADMLSRRRRAAAKRRHAACRAALMNQIFIPIERVHLETVFERGKRTEYALLEPQGQVSPLRIRFEDLRRELSARFSDELPAQTIVDRIAQMEDEQLLVTVTLEH